MNWRMYISHATVWRPYSETLQPSSHHANPNRQLELYVISLPLSHRECLRGGGVRDRERRRRRRVGERLMLWSLRWPLVGLFSIPNRLLRLAMRSAACNPAHKHARIQTCKQIRLKDKETIRLLSYAHAGTYITCNGRRAMATMQAPEFIAAEVCLKHYSSPVFVCRAS